MSCVTGFVEPVLFVRWNVPEEADILKISKEVSASRAKASKDLCFIGIIPEDTPPPSTKVRSMMSETMDGMLAQFATMHVVIEGTGFKNSLLRSVAAGILLVSGKRGRCFVHANLDEALREAGKATKLDPASVRRKARALQIAP
jgi:hypothetical protein